METNSVEQANFGAVYVKTKKLNLGEDGNYFALYKAHPYFVDVLEWLDGIRPFSAIRHNYSEDDFRKIIVPDVLAQLKREKLIQLVGGRLKPVHHAVLLRNMPADPLIHCEIVHAQIQALLEHAFDNRYAPKIDIVRTKASPEQIRDWRRKLIHIFEDIEDHDDPDGVPFTLNMVSLQEANAKQS